MRRVLQATYVLALLALASAPARASTAYGDLNNFDVFNDTGQECHGFEIELEDLHSTDITYTYDWNHYGAPTITEDNSNPAHPKVFIRYAAKYTAGTFSAFTAVPSTAPSPTNGHMCTNPSVNYGCEHFGVGYYGTPSVVRYNWLIEDPTAPGTLIHGPAVNVSTPTWAYYPPAPNQPAQVQAVILAPPPPPAPVYEFGDAVWVKTIVTTSHNNAVVELEDLVSDDPADPNDVNWRNGEPDEVEVEWQILQTEFNNPDGANNDLFGALEDLPNGDEVVTRRYEFYKYAGLLDPETNEAKCDKYPPISDPNDPAFNAECDETILGDYIGAQMAGFNVEAILGLIDHVQDGSINELYTARTVVVGGNTPYVTEVTSGALPPGLSIDSTTGVLSGTPSAAGAFTFTITATDFDAVQVIKPYTMTIAGLPDPCDGVICTALDQCHDAGICDPATGICSNPVKADNTPCSDGNACTTNDVCSSGSCAGTDASATACNDGNACTTDSCDPATGCLNTNNNDACDDGNACTTGDVCSSGSCAGTDTSATVCNDGNVCTTDSCDPATGCSNTNNNDPCDDGDVCTQGDTCQAGSCSGTYACGSADLSLRVRGPRNAKVGGTIAFTVKVRNGGPDAAVSATAELACSGAPFHFDGTQPSGCVGTAGSMTCSLGTLGDGASIVTDIAIVPDGVGTLTCAASASSSTTDPVPTNQSQTAETRVR